MRACEYRSRLQFRRPLHLRRPRCSREDGWYIILSRCGGMKTRGRARTYALEASFAWSWRKALGSLYPFPWIGNLGHRFRLPIGLTFGDFEEHIPRPKF